LGIDYLGGVNFLKSKGIALSDKDEHTKKSDGGGKTGSLHWLELRSAGTLQDL